LRGKGSFCGMQIRGEHRKLRVPELDSEWPFEEVRLSIAHSHGLVADVGHLSQNGLSHRACRQITSPDRVASVEKQSPPTSTLQICQPLRGSRREAIVEIGCM